MMQMFLRDGTKFKIIIETPSTHCDMIWKMGPILESNKGRIGNDARVPEGWNEVEKNH